MARPFLITLLERLAEALSADERDDATRAPDGAGVTRTFRAGDAHVEVWAEKDLRATPAGRCG